MVRNTLKALAVMMAVALLCHLPGGLASAESLNPEGVNPHAESPKKRISLERKMAAAEARKKKQAEIAARNAGQPAQTGVANQGAPPADFVNDLSKSDK